jgi:hypothetical protein
LQIEFGSFWITAGYRNHSTCRRTKRGSTAGLGVCIFAKVEGRTSRWIPRDGPCTRFRWTHRYHYSYKGLTRAAWLWVDFLMLNDKFGHGIFDSRRCKCANFWDQLQPPFYLLVNTLVSTEPRRRFRGSEPYNYRCSPQLGHQAVLEFRGPKNSERNYVRKLFRLQIG